MALLVGEVNALLVISVDGQGSEVAEVELDDVVVRPSDYFEIVDGDSFFAVDQESVSPVLLRISSILKREYLVMKNALK